MKSKNIFYVILYCFLLVFLVVFGSYCLSTSLPEKEGEEAIFYAQEMGQDLRLLFRKAIESAKESLTLSMYNITDASLINALNKQAEKGLKVRIYYDGKAKGNNPHNFYKTIRQIPWSSHGLMHQKILIVDKEAIFLGSSNFTWSSLGIHGNFVMGFKSKPSAAFLLESFKQQLEDHKKIEKPVFVSEGNQSYEIWMLPDASESKNRLLKLINTAQKTIKVAMYTWTRADFAESITEAKKRGVDVEIAVDQNSLGKFSKAIQILKKNQIPFYVYDGPGLLHHKFVWVDNTLVHGSANWTQAAFNQNCESFMILNQMTCRQNEFMEKLWKKLKETCKSEN